jgi:hypothetical protein
MQALPGILSAAPVLETVGSGDAPPPPSGGLGPLSDEPMALEPLIAQAGEQMALEPLPDQAREQMALEPLPDQKEQSYQNYVHECLHLHGNPNEDCPVCKVAKQRRHYAYRVPEENKVYEKVFAAKTSFDTYEAGKQKQSVGVGRFKYAIAPVDEASGFASFTPSKNKDTSSEVDGLMQHLGKDVKKAKGFYCDGAPSFKKLCKLLNVPPRFATPYTPTSNSRHERWMETLGDGIRCLLYASGLTSAWWPFAGQYFCLAWNILHVNIRTGKTAYQFRYPEKPTPTLMPFGSRCTFVPPKRSDDQTLHKQEPRGREGI